MLVHNLMKGSVTATQESCMNTLHSANIRTRPFYSRVSEKASNVFQASLCLIPAHNILFRVCMRQNRLLLSLMYTHP